LGNDNSRVSYWAYLMLATVLLNLPFGGHPHVRRYILPDGTVTNDLQWARYLLSTMEGDLSAEVEAKASGQATKAVDGRMGGKQAAEVGTKKIGEGTETSIAVAGQIRTMTAPRATVLPVQYDGDEDFVFILSYV